MLRLRAAVIGPAVITLTAAAAGCRAATAPAAGAVFELTTARASYAPGDTAVVVLHVAGGSGSMTYSHCPVFLDRATGDGSWTAVVAPGPDVVCTLELPVVRPGSTTPILALRIPATAGPGTYRVRVQGAFGPVDARGPSRTLSTPGFQVGAPQS